MQINLKKTRKMFIIIFKKVWTSLNFINKFDHFLLKSDFMLILY